MSIRKQKPAAKGANRQRRKTGHDPKAVRDVCVWDIRPAPENDLLYRPVDSADPEIIALAQSVRRNGVLEPLVISRDGWLISGHRRFVAAKLVALEKVPCRVHPIRRDRDRDGFVRLLSECNRQRVKSLDEVLHESVVQADPEEAYRALCTERYEAARIDAETMHIPASRRRPKLSAARWPLLTAVQEVVRDRRQYWPLSDRQIHYALLNDPPRIHAGKPGSRYANDKRSYKVLCDLLTRARLSSSIPMKAIADSTRPNVVWTVHRSPDAFVRKQMDGFLAGYYRDMMASQPNHIEIVAEKLTVESIVRRVAMRYVIPYVIGRGYCSLAPRAELAERFQRSGKETLVLLLISDFDPDGVQIAESFAASMRDDFDIDVQAVRVALTREQVEELELPTGMQAKQSSANHGKFVARYGTNVYELEAVAPETLEDVIDQAIRRVVDIDRFNAETEQLKRDAAELSAMKQRMQAALRGLTSDGKQDKS